MRFAAMQPVASRALTASGIEPTPPLVRHERNDAMVEHMHDRSAHAKARCGSHDRAPTQAADALKDPVCGMSVTPASRHRHDHAGTTYYFCSAGCKAKFQADPDKYLSGAAAKAAAPASKDVIYTCPMHPEIRQVGPGTCPKCGMALEPAVASAEDQPNPELIDMTRRFWIGAALTAPVFVLAMIEHLPGLHFETVSPGVSGWTQFALSLPVVLWAGWPFFARGWKSLVSRNLNMYTLIALGTGVAFAYSAVALVAPHLFPPAFRDASGHVGLYFEAAAVIVVLVLLGEVLQ